MKKLLFITGSISYGYGTEKSLADILNRIDKSKYSIDVLPLFKNTKDTILNTDIKVLEPLIDYTKENCDEKKDLDYYYSILASPLKFNKLLKDRYDCVIACNHNAPSYFASYMNNTPKVVWIRGDMSELNYNNFNPTTVEYSGIKQEYNMQKNVLKTFDNIVVISEVVRKALKDNFGITENIYEIPNSVDSEKIKELSNEKIKLPKEHLFTTLGRLDNNKNQILLLKAAKIAKKHSWNKGHFYFIDKPCEKRNPGYPLDSMSIMPECNKYFVDLTDEDRNKNKKDYIEDEVIDFIVNNV